MGGNGGGSPSSGPSGLLASFLPFFLIILIMYFLIIRPQVKRQREQKAMLDTLQKGDRVVTTGGIHGTVAGFKEKEGIVILKVADNIKIELSKGAVSRVVKAGDNRADNETPVKTGE
ncbi:MAG: preprotein translocase subunit YajC [Candidatus Handelsmanbacteria bacterium RIFCSPLOWO2_12_FULL_64_10]|uniref:Preprotein translocase subunit YajC n=1 Tax=Handelsmanbacteria sp. (strain RIFCSPLOWO2_12_FULL_64_10) TaxID=1817868 RepID=A0A1F6CT63_HANXR|nr:MAG: preprotein translocase subunit YajC [Candidatus Handelsmanbacteria bacterium RIFCSPLOWO2_12_FULL_64_10]